MKEPLTKMAHQVRDFDQRINGDDYFEQRRRSFSPKKKRNDDEKSVVEEQSSSNNKEEGLVVPAPEDAGKEASTLSEPAPENDNGRERLKRHRIEVAGRVWIPEIWGQEDLLKDWIDCNAFDACLVPNGIISARASLVEEGRRATSRGLGIENRC